MRRQRLAKIVATLGPATSSVDAIAGLFEAGADVFRLNLSHGTHAEHEARCHNIRAVEKRYGHPLGVLADLQGPKLRIGSFANGPVELAKGQTFRLDLDPAPGNAARAPMPHPEIFSALQPGHMLLLNDGRVRLRVADCCADHADTIVEVGGPLSDHKGVNVPDTPLAVSALTDKDREDLEFALSLGVPWIGLSFVQTSDDVDEAMALIAGRAGLIAKIEKPQAAAHAQHIIHHADAIMVARGDLGVEMPMEDVPMIQKRLVRACRGAGKPVIVATQMLESMVRAPVPTRAEASDVSTAVNEGADAVMLSEETAVGDYPREAVGMMDRIIRRVESDSIHRAIVDAVHMVPETSTAAAITNAARLVSETAAAVAIVTFTTSGATTLRAARERPSVPILALTPSMTVGRRLALVYGVHAVSIEAFDHVDILAAHATQLAIDEGFAEAGDRIVITAGLPLQTPGTTNLLHIVDIPGGDGDDDAA